MNIGFDLDKVFINYPPLVPGAMIEKFYKEKSNGELLYRIPKRPEQLFRTAIHHPLLRLPIKNNLTFLSSLPKDKHKLYLISSRFGFLRKRTEALVKKYHFDEIFHGLYFNYENKQPHLFKNEIIQALHLEMYIDDDFQLLKYVAKENKKTKFFWLTNKKPQQLTKNIVSINSLPAIFA
ncbi:hypothetical protein BH11PAT1_BH11PAT1_7010 [soil metagenome]